MIKFKVSRWILMLPDFKELTGVKNETNSN